VVQALPMAPELAREAEHLSPAELLTKAVEWRDHPVIEMALRMQVSQLEMTLPAGDDGVAGREMIQQVRSVGLSAADEIGTLLTEGLPKGLQNQLRWFYSTGGITKDYGLLTGTLQVRPSWRYSPGDDLVMALLGLCFVEDDGRNLAQRLPVMTLLARLKRRFGLLVDHPPAALDSAEARSGAADNLDAFCRKLQLLGCFQGLSDDLSAQFVTRPRADLI
jgi:hypothetical protein